MDSVRGLTAERMLQIEADVVVDGYVNASGELVLLTRGGTTINAGSVVIEAAAQNDAATALLLTTDTVTRSAFYARFGLKTGSSNTVNLSPSSTNIIGPGAGMYNVLGGSSIFPHHIGNSTLAFFTGYDNKNWDNTIASVNMGHHGFVGGISGHPTLVGGSMGASFGGYGVVVGGTELRNFGNYAAALSGARSSAGANAVTKLSVAIAVGDTSITVDSISGVVVGQHVFIGSGTQALSGASGGGALERAKVVAIAGNVVTLDTATFWNDQEVTPSGVSLATAFASTHPVGTKAYFVSTGGTPGAAVVAGIDTDVTGSGAFGHGIRNKIAGLYSAGLGADHLNDQEAGMTFGRGARPRNVGEVAYAQGFTLVPGDRQGTMGIRSLITTNATTMTLPIIQNIPSGITFAWSCEVVARDMVSGDSKLWFVEGLVRCSGTTVTQVNSGASGTSEVPTVKRYDSATASWGITILTGAATLNLRCTGAGTDPNGRTIRWVSRNLRIEAL